MKPVVLIPGLLLALAAPAPALFGLFEQDAPQDAPAPEERASQEQQAAGLMQQAEAQANAGDGGAAAKTLEEVVDRYPFTNAAGQAQFSLGMIEEQRGRHDKAIEAYQRVITRYPNSGRFGDALSAQYRLAEAARAGQIQTSFLGLARNYDSTDVQQWYLNVVNAGPRSELAAPSLLAIGQIQAGNGDRQAATETLQRLVRDYPESKAAPEGQLLLAEVLGGSAGGLNNESRTLQAQQDALQDMETLYGDDPEIAAQAQERLSAVESRQAANDLEIAQFYERRGNLRAASIYYREVLRYEGTPEYATAQGRLAELGVDEGPIGADADAQLRALAQEGSLLTSRSPNYVGPPAPELGAAAGGEMRLPEELLDLDALPDAPGAATSDLFMQDTASAGEMPDLGDDADVTPTAPGATASNEDSVTEAQAALDRARKALEELKKRNAENQAQLEAAENTDGAAPTTGTAPASTEEAAEAATEAAVDAATEAAAATENAAESASEAAAEAGDSAVEATAEAASTATETATDATDAATDAAEAAGEATEEAANAAEEATAEAAEAAADAPPAP